MPILLPPHVLLAMLPFDWDFGMEVGTEEALLLLRWREELEVCPDDWWLAADEVVDRKDGSRTNLEDFSVSPGLASSEGFPEDDDDLQTFACGIRDDDEPWAGAPSIRSTRGIREVTSFCNR